MAKITISVDEHLLIRARTRALEDGTSVDAVLHAYLERYAGMDDVTQASTDFTALVRRQNSTSGPEGRTWTRDEIHDRSGS